MSVVKGGFTKNAVASFIILTLVSCTSLPGSRVENIQSQAVEFTLNRGDMPAVIFENGLGGKMDWWAKIFPEVAKSQTAFAYNRPGYGHSARGISPRDGRTVVEDLRSRLQELKIAPPYILVGHSLGGLYMQYFARRYPDEVKALILVDSTHPQQMSGDGAFDKWPWWIRKLVFVITPKAGLEELAEIEKTGKEVLDLPPLDTKKVKAIIMIASEPENPKTPLEKNAVLMRQDFHRLYPEATFVTIKGDHFIPWHSPEEVLRQIRSASQKTLP